MRPEDPRGPYIAKVVLISGAFASTGVFQGYTEAGDRGAWGGGPPGGMAFRGVFSRFEVA